MQSFVTFSPYHDYNMNDSTLIRLKKWMRKSSIAFFDRNDDVLAAPGYVQLGNPIVVAAMSTGFEPVSRDTHFITCRARYILSNNLKATVYQESEIFGAETALDTVFEQMHEYFDTRIDQGEKKLLAIGFNPVEMQRNLKNYETRTVTNSVTQYCDILSKADYYLTILNYLWLMAELADSPEEARKAKLTTEQEVRDNLFAIVRATTGHYNNIRRLCNAVIEKRKLEREEQSRRDRNRAKQKLASKASGGKTEEARRKEAQERRAKEKAKGLMAAQEHQDILAAGTVAV